MAHHAQTTSGLAQAAAYLPLAAFKLVLNFQAHQFAQPYTLVVDGFMLARCAAALNLYTVNIPRLLHISVSFLLFHVAAGLSAFSAPSLGR